MIMAEKALTPEEIAERLNISVRNAVDYLRTGIIPEGYKIGGQWRVDEPDFLTYIADQKQKTRSQKDSEQ